MDVARHVGGKVQEKFGWGVKMKNFDIEYVINVDDNQAYAGIGKKKKIMKKLVKLCLHSSYITQNFFHFDEIFTENFKLQFWFYWKNSVKLCLHLHYIAHNSFRFDEIFHRKFKIPILSLNEKIPSNFVNIQAT